MNIMLKKTGLAAAALCSTLILGACKNITPDYYVSGQIENPPWTISRAEVTLAGDDPLEGFNRSMFEVNDMMMEYVARPVGWVYCSILPRPAIDAINRAALNLEYPGRVISCLGSARLDGAWDETFRFLVNSTIGLAGLFDPAGEWWHFYSTNSDFGLMFASWGIGPGCTFVLPLCRKTNLRDVTGAAFDYALDIKTWLPYTSWVSVNTAMYYQPMYESTLAGTSDRYQRFRIMTALERQANLDLNLYNARKSERAKQKAIQADPDCAQPNHIRSAYVKPSGFKSRWLAVEQFEPENSRLDTLRAIHVRPVKSAHYWYYPLSIFNNDFAGRMSERSLAIQGVSEKAHYAFIKSEQSNTKREKLAVLLPGIGARRMDGMTLAIAELMHENGFSVLTTDSVFRWDFMLSAGKMMFPGFSRDDAQNIRDLIKLALEDLKKRGDITNPDISIIGWSWGGLDTLFIADLERKEIQIGVKRFLALNPPVDPEYASVTADSLKSASSSWSAEKMRSLATSTVTEFLMMQKRPLPPFIPSSSPNEEQISKYKVGTCSESTDMLLALDLSMSLREILYNAHKRNNLTGISTPYKWDERLRLYDELDLIDFRTYAEKFVMPRFKEKFSFDGFCMRSGLRAIKETLEKDSSIRIIHTYDDFLINNADRIFLDNVLGDRLLWLDCGGHLGSLYCEQVHKAIVSEAE